MTTESSAHAQTALATVSLFAWGMLASENNQEVVIDTTNLPSWQSAHTGHNPSRPAKSELELIEPSQLASSFELRHSLSDLAVFEGRHGCRTHKNNARIVFRNGLVAHFAYRESFDAACSPTLLDELATIPNKVIAHLDELALEAQGWGVLIDFDSTAQADEVWAALIESQEVLAASHSSRMGAACLVGDFEGAECLFHLRTRRTNVSLVDNWYYHWLTCEASRSAMTEKYAAFEHATTSVSLTVKNDGELRREQFRASLAVRQKISNERANLAATKFRDSIIRDFRKIHAVDDKRAAILEDVGAQSVLSKLPGVPSVYDYLLSEFDNFYADRVRIFIDVMEAALDRADDDARAVVELANMSYNTLIQEAVQRLQWLALIVSVVSLILGIISISH